MKKNLFIIIAALVILTVGGSVVLWRSRTERNVATQGTPQVAIQETPRVIEETLVVPDTQEVHAADARILEQGAVAVPLIPKSEEEKVIVERAELTLKGGYTAAALVANQWDSAAMLVFVKSLGAITLDGKSSSWQVMFSSPDKKDAGYEVILQGKEIVSKKEVASDASGVALPQNWKDSGEFIKILRERASFTDATISSLLFSSTPESKDVQWWFSISTSKGTVTFEVR